MEFKEGSGNFRFRNVMTNITIHGLSSFKLQNVKWVQKLSLALGTILLSYKFNHVNEDGMGGACSTHGEMRNAYHICQKN
jgi:hypothetical protein